MWGAGESGGRGVTHISAEAAGCARRELAAAVQLPDVDLHQTRKQF